MRPRKHARRHRSEDDEFSLSPLHADIRSLAVKLFVWAQRTEMHGKQAVQQRGQASSTGRIFTEHEGSQTQVFCSARGFIVAIGWFPPRFRTITCLKY